MENCENKWKHLWNNVHAELNKMNVNKSGNRDLSPNKMESRWRGFDLSFVVVVVVVVRYLECNRYGKKPAFSICVT
jgi:hypothetical protein